MEILAEKKICKKISETEKSILSRLENILVSVSEKEREKILSFGEGMAFMKNNRQPA